MRFASALFAALFAAACHDFRNLASDGRCGNGILEQAAGEDCDLFVDPLHENAKCGAPGTEHQCEFICTDGGACPKGWGCGLDGACRAPSAQLDDLRVVPIDGDTLKIGDADGDRRQDILHVANTAVHVAYGDPDARFTQTTDFRIASPSVPPAVGDIDGDGIVDLAVAEPVGILIARGQRNRSFDPLTISSEDLPASEADFYPLPLRAARPYTRDLVLGLFKGGGGLDARVLDATTTTISAGARSALGALEMDLAEHLAVANLDAGASGDEAAIVTNGATRVAIISVSCGGDPARCGIELRQTVDLDAPAEAEGTFFSDVDGDGAIDLIVVTGQNGRKMLSIAGGDGTGHFAPRAEIDAARSSAMDCTMCMSQGVALLAAVDLDGDSISDYVTAEGIFATTSAEPFAATRVALSTTPWRHATVADFNLDGRPDVAGARPTGIDIFIAAGDGEFNTLQAPIAAPPSGFATGDFDGDLFVDLAVLEGMNVVSVLFGNQSGVPEDRVVMSSGRPIAHLASLIDSRGGRLRDRLSDLVVATQPGLDGVQHVIRLAGSSSRRMIAPLDTPDYVLGIAIGRFRAHAERDLGSDVLFAMNAMGQIVFALATNESLLGDAKPEAPILPTRGDCPTLGGLRSVFEVRDLDGDGIDEIVALDLPLPFGMVSGDYQLHVYRFIDGTLVCEDAGSIAPAIDVGQPSHIEIADFDHDELLDVAVGFERTNVMGMGQTNYGPAIGVWWGQAGAPFLAPGAPLLIRVDAQPSIAAFTAAELDGDPGAELAFVDAAGVKIAELDREAIIVRPDYVSFPRDVNIVSAVDRLDANADGIDGIAIGTDDEVFIVPQKPCDAKRFISLQCERGGTP